MVLNIKAFMFCLLAGASVLCAGDFRNTVTGELKVSANSPDYTTPEALAEGWVSVDRKTQFPGPKRGRADWVWDEASDRYRFQTPGERAAKAAEIVLRSRAALLGELQDLRVKRQNVRVAPPSWANEEVLARLEADYDARIAAVVARGAAP